MKNDTPVRKPGRRKETTAAVQIGPEFVSQTPHDAFYEAEKVRNTQLIVDEKELARIDKEFGDGEPYDEDRIIVETKTYLATSHHAYLEAGRRLLLLKAHTDHDGSTGGFHRALERVGIEPRTAQRLMLVARKFGARPALATLGQSKLLALAALQEEVLDELEDGGKVGDSNKDDLRLMSKRELEELVKKERQRRTDEAAASEKLLTSKDDKLNKMERELIERTTRVKSWNGVVTELSKNVMDMSLGAIMHIQHLREQVNQVLLEAENFDLSDQEMAAIVKPFADQLTQLWAYMHELQAEFDHNLAGYSPMYLAGSSEHLED